MMKYGAYFVGVRKNVKEMRFVLFKKHLLSPDFVNK